MYLGGSFLKEAVKNLEVKITNVVTSDYNGTEVFKVTFKVESGNHEGKEFNTSYFMNLPGEKPDGTPTRGTIWLFRRLMVACGFFTEDDKNVRHVTEDFDEKMLVGKTCVVDAEYQGDDKKYLNATNERYLDDFLKGQAV